MTPPQRIETQESKCPQPPLADLQHQQLIGEVRNVVRHQNSVRAALNHKLEHWERLRQVDVIRFGFHVTPPPLYPTMDANHMQSSHHIALIPRPIRYHVQYS